MKNQQMISHIGDNTNVIVHFDYHPGRPARLYGDCPEPAVPEMVEINKICIVNDNVYDDLHNDTVERIETECLEYIHAQRDEAMERAANERGGR